MIQINQQNKKCYPSGSKPNWLVIRNFGSVHCTSSFHEYLVSENIRSKIQMKTFQSQTILPPHSIVKTNVIHSNLITTGNHSTVKREQIRRSWPNITEAFIGKHKSDSTKVNTHEHNDIIIIHVFFYAVWLISKFRRFDIKWMGLDHFWSIVSNNERGKRERKSERKRESAMVIRCG